MTERDLFLAALEIDDPAARADLLDRECADDPGLRERVGVLLGAHTASGAFMDRPAVGGTLTGPGSPGALVGSRIGPYKLLQVIGEGGFGVVYMAEQDRPVSRRVALKVIKPGMDSAAVLARFEAERQALAMMDHPNIARVFEAGATPDGRPFFVMELVKGVPITEFCDANKMPPAARLGLFVQVCQAVQHAHQKGVIHRDLKPSNILVTLHDGVPVPKVIDFGVAKATAQKLTERTLFTAFGQMVGTPAYMSPEQAEMSGLDVDTRSDIYSLGVLLYELLTGTTPLDLNQLRDAGYAEMQRLIKEEEAPRPSNRLSSLGDSATIVADHRGMDARQLTRQLAGDLDWIVLKALAKDRTRRYDSPGEFAADVNRYLRHEAILARPPSAAYRLRTFVRRNRPAVGAAAAIAVALLAGTAVAIWQAVAATQARKDAEAAAAAERVARQSADASTAAERETRMLVERREAAGKAILTFLERRILGAAQPEGVGDGLGHDVTLRRALQVALPFLDEGFPEEPIIEARLRNMFGVAFGELGDWATAVTQFEKARALYVRQLGPGDPDTLRAILNLAIAYNALDRSDEAVRLEENALPLLTAALGEKHPEVLQAATNLGACYVRVGRPVEARNLLERVVETRTAIDGPNHVDTQKSRLNLSNALEAMGESDAAMKLREDVLARLRAGPGRTDPDALTAAHCLANSYENARRIKETRELREETFRDSSKRLGPGHPDTLHRAISLGWTYGRTNQWRDALPLFEDAVKRLAGHPSASLRQIGLAKWGQATSLTRLGRGAEAIPIIDDCVALAARRRLDPHLLAAVLTMRLRYYQQGNDPAGCRKSAEMWEGLSRSDPESLYTAARFRAVAAAVARTRDPGPTAEDDARTAVDWLRKALAAGWSDLKVLAADKDFDGVRGRPDFQALAAGGK